MPKAKGSPKTGGRVKGTPNKLTTSAKEAFALAFDSLGGWEGMAKWANSDPENRKVFYTLYARLIPVDMTSGGDKLPVVTVTFTDAKD